MKKCISIIVAFILLLVCSVAVYAAGTSYTSITVLNGETGKTVPGTVMTASTGTGTFKAQSRAYSASGSTSNCIAFVTPYNTTTSLTSATATPGGGYSYSTRVNVTAGAKYRVRARMDSGYSTGNGYAEVE